MFNAKPFWEETYPQFVRCGRAARKYAGWEIVAHEEGTFRDTILGISIMSTPLNALWPENLEYSMA